MNDNEKEHHSLKSQLDQELHDLQFERKQHVLRQTHPKSVKDTLSSIWNKEVSIPVIPVVSACVVALVFAVNPIQLTENQPKKEVRQLVDTGAGIYWSDVLKEGVTKK